MSDDPTPAPAPPPVIDPEVLAIARGLSRVLGWFHGGASVFGKTLRFADRWVGWAALLLVLCGTPGGCHLPHIPWPIPTPTPTPVPPQPPSPIPGDGLRVLIVYDASAALPAAQQAIIDGADVRAYLNAHCATDGKQKEYRVLPVTTDVSNESAVWQGAMKLRRQSLPWLIVGNGKTGFQGPLPATVADTLALLQTFGGK